LAALGLSWAVLEVVLESSGRLGRSWVGLGLLLAALGLSWAVLG